MRRFDIALNKGSGNALCVLSPSLWLAPGSRKWPRNSDCVSTQGNFCLQEIYPESERRRSNKGSGLAPTLLGLALAQLPQLSREHDPTHSRCEIDRSTTPEDSQGRSPLIPPGNTYWCSCRIQPAFVTSSRPLQASWTVWFPTASSPIH